MYFCAAGAYNPENADSEVKESAAKYSFGIKSNLKKLSNSPGIAATGVCLMSSHGETIVYVAPPGGASHGETSVYVAPPGGA